MQKNTDFFDYIYYTTHKTIGSVSYREGGNNISLFEFHGMYVKQIEPDFPNMVCVQKQYSYDSLKIEAQGSYLKFGGVNIGIWEYYNEDGTINHTENMDKHFPVTWEQLEEILKDKDISLLSADSIFRYYDEEKDEATWSIIIKLPMEKGCLYVFDARTGELLNTKILNMRKQL